MREIILITLYQPSEYTLTINSEQVYT